MNATVKDVMTTEVVAVRRETTFKELAAALRRYRVSALPVVDDAGLVLGVVSEADLLAKEVLADPGLVAEHVPGVVAVRDRLSYPDTYPVVAGPVF